MDSTKYILKKANMFGIPSYNFCDINENILYKMKRKAISFGNKYKIFDINNNIIGEVNASIFKRSIYQIIYNGSVIDNVTKTSSILKPEYFLDKLGLKIVPNVLYTKIDVFDKEKLIMTFKRNNIMDYLIELFDIDKFYICPMLALTSILLYTN